MGESPSAQPSRSPSSSEPTQAPTMADGFNVIYYQTSLTCNNGDQKISQPCNGGTGTGCSYDVCMQHCFDEIECNFFFHITSTSGCILYRSCDDTRNPDELFRNVDKISLSICMYIKVLCC